jgi:CheY-like chemotaxis protein
MMITKVLLVEDDPDDRLLTKDAFLFIDKDIVVDTVNDGEEALSYLDTLQPYEYPTLIVLDYNMPRINGIETLQLLTANRRFRGIPVAILTTSTDPMYRQQCLTLGAGRFYSKPVVYSQLVSIAKELLEWSTEASE